MSTMRRSLAACAIAALGASFAGAASAQGPTAAGGPAPLSGAEVTLAETLYREGRKLMAEQRYVEACAKFTESHRLDPATGTLLNIATCQEAQGKLASAWIAFSEAARAARREGREDRLKFAEEHIRALEPRLSRLTVDVAAGPAPNDLKIMVDGFAIGPAAYGVAAPIDPGTHRVEAWAPGFEKWTTDVVVGGAADHRVVTIPALSPESAPATSAPEVPVRPVVASPVHSPEAEPPARPIPTSVYVSGAATLLLTGAAVVTGLTYLDRNDERERDEAKLFGWLNMGFTAAALVGAGVTTLLYTTRPEQPRTGRFTPRIQAWVLPTQGGLALTSEF
jgi:hypothetical protein